MLPAHVWLSYGGNETSRLSLRDEEDDDDDGDDDEEEDLPQLSCFL